MRSRFLRGPLAACAALAAASCVQTPAASSPIHGLWIGTSENASGSSFDFRNEGTATWSLQVPFEIRYRVEPGPTPHTLDLYGFESGPLKGRTLYCLIELTKGDRMLMDCEPTQRPTQLDPKQTQAFVHTRRAR